MLAAFGCQHSLVGCYELRRYLNRAKQSNIPIHNDYARNLVHMVGVCNCSMFCCTLIYVHSSIAIILMGKRKLIALLNLSSWCLVMVERLFLVVPWGCLQFVIVVFPDHTHLLFLIWYVSLSFKNLT